MGRPRTLTREEVLTAIQTLMLDRGIPPTVAELKRELRVGSNRTVLRYLSWLEEAGDIERWPGARGIRLRRSSGGGLDTKALPVVGTAPAGPLMAAEENWQGFVRIPRSLLKPPGGRFFLLRVRGSSMNRAIVSGDRIESGDLVLVRQQAHADSNDVVVALIDGEATIKRLRREKGLVVLKPESSDPGHSPIVVGSEFRSQGIVVHVIKSGSSLIEE